MDKDDSFSLYGKAASLKTKTKWRNCFTGEVSTNVAHTAAIRHSGETELREKVQAQWDRSSGLLAPQGSKTLAISTDIPVFPRASSTEVEDMVRTKVLASYLRCEKLAVGSLVVQSTESTGSRGTTWCARTSPPPPCSGCPTLHEVLDGEVGSTLVLCMCVNMP